MAEVQPNLSKVSTNRAQYKTSPLVFVAEVLPRFIHEHGKAKEEANETSQKLPHKCSALHRPSKGTPSTLGEHCIGQCTAVHFLGWFSSLRGGFHKHFSHYAPRGDTTMMSPLAIGNYEECSMLVPIGPARAYVGLLLGRTTTMRTCDVLLALGLSAHLAIVAAGRFLSRTSTEGDASALYDGIDVVAAELIAHACWVCCAAAEWAAD